MRITYDPRYNIAYIRISESSVQVRTVQLADDLNVDIGPDGSVYGFELLDARRQLFENGDGRLVITNEQSGEERMVEFSRN